MDPAKVAESLQLQKGTDPHEVIVVNDSKFYATLTKISAKGTDQLALPTLWIKRKPRLMLRPWLRFGPKSPFKLENLNHGRADRLILSALTLRRG